jgi:hypothetical protein
MTDNKITLELGGALTLYLSPPPAQGRVMVTATYKGFTATAEGTHMAYTLPVGNFVVLQVSYVDAGGNPAVVDGAVLWASSDPNMLPVVVDATDSSLCTINAPLGIGQAQVTATADADLGAGVRNLVTLLDVTVIAGEAVAGVIAPTGAAQPMSETG